MAVLGGHYNIVKQLIDLKVNINPMDRWGCTPLDDANDKAIEDLLIKNGGIKKKSMKKKSMIFSD